MNAEAFNGFRKYLFPVASVAIFLLTQAGILVWWASGISRDVYYGMQDRYRAKDAERDLKIRDNEIAQLKTEIRELRENCRR